MLKCKILGRNLINGTEQEFDIREGAVFTEYYNETLDSGTITIPQLSAKIQIEPYDIIVIYDTNSKINQKRLCVDTYTCTQTSLDPAIYNYDITLFSETKLLEGILLPNLSITMRKNAYQRTIWDYLYEYLYEYNIYNDWNNGFSNAKFSYSNDVYNKFNSTICPEMQWNEPTLREVITDLMMVLDCIPVVNNNVISYIDITQIGSEITTAQRNGINYIQESQSSADYVSEIKMSIQNSISSINKPNENTTIVEEIGFRNSNTYIVDTNNMIVETNQPMWDLVSCKIYFKARGEVRCINNYGEPDEYSEVHDDIYDIGLDLTPYILEYGVWQTKDIKYNGFNAGNQSLSTTYQNTCLYYIRGNNNIFNFNAKQNTQQWFISSQVSVYELIINGELFMNEWKRIAQEKYPNFEVYQYEFRDYDTGTITGEPKDILEGAGSFKYARFSVEYKNLTNCVFFASKSPYMRNKRQIVDNQTTSYPDIDKLGFLEYLKANRLGNKVKLINGRYNDSESNIPQLSQTINSSIIFKKEIAVYDNYLKVNYQATDNYVLRDYFTGIKSKLRSWKIVDGKEALLRAENRKFYVNSNLQSISTSNYLIPSYSNLDKYLEDFNYCCISFYSSETGDIPSRYSHTYNGTDYIIDKYLVEFTKRKCGNSVLFTITMKDNAVVGSNYVYNADGTGGMYQKNSRYVDSNGGFTSFEIWFSKRFVVALPTSTDTKIYTAIKPGINYSQMDGVVFKYKGNMWKDNKEIFQITFQFELNQEANDIFLGKK